jgi:hypothetical protein
VVSKHTGFENTNVLSSEPHSHWDPALRDLSPLSKGFRAGRPAFQCRGRLSVRQMSCAYPWMVLSLENLPIRATVRIALRAQALWPESICEPPTSVPGTPSALRVWLPKRPKPSAGAGEGQGACAGERGSSCPRPSTGFRPFLPVWHTQCRNISRRVRYETHEGTLWQSRSNRTVSM